MASGAMSKLRLLRQSRPEHALHVVESQPGLALHATSKELWVAVHLKAVPAHNTLETLATVAQRFTPRISLVPPDGVLLEVKGSLNLFGGAPALHAAVIAQCNVLNLQTTVALAPTPLAALAGARSRRAFIITDPQELIGHVSSLPLAALGWAPEVLERTKKIGVRTIGQALRLPRKGFARRFGVEPLTALDRLTGRQADLRRNFQPVERFRRRIDFDYELIQHNAIVEALRPVLSELGEFLRARQLGIMRLDFRLRHRQPPATRCTVQLALPTADAGHLEFLLGEHLAALQLREPVRACELRSDALLSRSQASESLWTRGETGSEGAGIRSAALIERLSAKLGTASVTCLGITAGHRPEKVWHALTPAIQTNLRNHRVPWQPFRRPLWLLEPPELLDDSAGLPQRAGGLQLTGEPERIESGWWDCQPIARDYYIAIDSGGARLWIYRERRSPHSWYLHGIFG